MPDNKAVEYVSEIRQVKTMADRTYNVTLNLPEYCKDQAAWFLKHVGEMAKGISELEFDEPDVREKTGNARSSKR